MSVLRVFVFLVYVLVLTEVLILFEEEVKSTTQIIRRKPQTLEEDEVKLGDLI